MPGLILYKLDWVKRVDLHSMWVVPVRSDWVTRPVLKMGRIQGCFLLRGSTVDADALLEEKILLAGVGFHSLPKSKVSKFSSTNIQPESQLTVQTEIAKFRLGLAIGLGWVKSG